MCARSLFAAVAALVLGGALSGCGATGRGGTNPRAITTPDRARLTPLQEQPFEAVVIDGGFDPSKIQWEVVEGDRGGTVRYADASSTDVLDRIRVVYTAPATTGTYHLRWRNNDGYEATAQITVVSE